MIISFTIPFLFMNNKFIRDGLSVPFPLVGFVKCWYQKQSLTVSINSNSVSPGPPGVEQFTQSILGKFMSPVMIQCEWFFNDNSFESSFSFLLLYCSKKIDFSVIGLNLKCK